MWVIGHRGAAGTWPENTLLSIRQAMHSGVNWVEIDVRLVNDTIIVLHDDTLERTTNGYGSVYGHSVADLRMLDAGNGELIPFLVEILDEVDAAIGVNIEVKQHGLEDQLLATISHYFAQQPRWHKRLMVSSFLPEVMRSLSGSAPAGCLLGALCETDAEGSIEIAVQRKMDAVNISFEQLSSAIVEHAHAQGLKMLVYTVNELNDVRRCVDFFVDGIFTDYPEQAIAFLNN
jgi:glycerophosphoryl diester phosphodiesterase